MRLAKGIVTSDDRFAADSGTTARAITKQSRLFDARECEGISRVDEGFLRFALTEPGLDVRCEFVTIVVVGILRKRRLSLFRAT